MQQRAREEVIDILGDVPYDVIPDVKQMKRFEYLDQILKEVCRGTILTLKRKSFIVVILLVHLFPTCFFFNKYSTDLTYTSPSWRRDSKKVDRGR